MLNDLVFFGGGFVTASILLLVTSFVVTPRLMSNPKVMSIIGRHVARKMMSNGKSRIPNS